MQQVQFRSEHLLAPGACVLLFLVVLIAALYKLQKSEVARDESKLLSGSASFNANATLDDGRAVRRSTRSTRPSEGAEEREEPTPANTPAKRTRRNAPATPADSEAQEPKSAAKEPKSPRGRTTRSARKPERGGKSPGRPRSVSRGRQRKEKA